MLDGTIDGYTAYEEAVAACPVTPILDEAAGGDMLYSSGTTGRPKGVFVPPRVAPTSPSSARCSRSAWARSAWAPGTVYLSPAPLYHAAPLGFSMACLRSGTVVVMEHFEAERALQFIERYRITHSQWVPTMFVRMLKLPDGERGDTTFRV